MRIHTLTHCGHTHCHTPSQPEEMKDASDEVAKLFSKSSSTFDPSPVTAVGEGEVAGLRKELTQLKETRSKSNGVGGAYCEVEIVMCVTRSCCL